MIKKISYKDQVYAHLKKAIINGEIKEGEIYSEKMFAEQLNISRTPVREAVLQLEHENLIEIYSNRGIGVKPITFFDIQQIIQARTAIEGYSIRYLINNIHTEEAQVTIKNLHECLIKSEELSEDITNHYEYMKADIEFHGNFVGFTKNIYFLKIFDQMHTRLEQITMNSLTLQNRLKDALAEHSQIFEYICDSNIEQAEEYFYRHMRITESILKKIFYSD